MGKAIDQSSEKDATTCERNNIKTIGEIKYVVFDLKSLLNKSKKPISVILSWTEKMNEQGRTKSLKKVFRNIITDIKDKYEEDKFLHNFNVFTVDKENYIELLFSMENINEKERTIVKRMSRATGSEVIDFAKIWENEIIKESASPEGGGIVFVVDDGFSNPVNENKFFKSHMKKLDFKVFQLTDCPSDVEMYKNSCSSLLNDDFSKKLEEAVTAMLEKQNTEGN